MLKELTLRDSQSKIKEAYQHSDRGPLSTCETTTE